MISAIFCGALLTLIQVAVEATPISGPARTLGCRPQGPVNLPVYVDDNNIAIGDRIGITSCPLKLPNAANGKNVRCSLIDVIKCGMVSYGRGGDVRSTNFTIDLEKIEYHGVSYYKYMRLEFNPTSYGGYHAYNTHFYSNNGQKLPKAVQRRYPYYGYPKLRVGDHDAFDVMPEERMKQLGLKLFIDVSDNSLEDNGMMMILGSG